MSAATATEEPTATPGPAATEEPEATQEPAQEFEFFFRGNVQFDGEPVEGVLITVEGNGFEAETETDAEGRWEVGVPEKGTYTVTLDENTLPEGVIVAEEGGAEREAEFGLTRNASVNFFLGEGERVTVSFWNQFLQRAVNGVNFGLLLALAAIGLSLIFGTTGLSNFAHAELITFGALMTLTFGTLGVPIWLAIIIAVILSAMLGWVLDAGLWKPLRKKGIAVIPLMIVSIGLSLALRYLFQFFYGGQTQQLVGATGVARFSLGPISLTWIDLASMGISIVVLLAVAFFLLRTRIGKATRAVSDNPSLASASGIDVNYVIRIVWVLGSALAGLSGILWAYFRPGVSWDMGFQILLLIFAAVVLGGLGTAFGALIGAVIVGLFVELSTLWLPSDMKYVGALVIMIVVLLFRPQGILGRRERIG